MHRIDDTIDPTDDAPNLLTITSGGVQATRKTSRGEELEQSRGALPKNLIHPLSLQDLKSEGFEDLLSRLPMHADAGME